jgi:hypothetical protein
LEHQVASQRRYVLRFHNNIAVFDILPTETFYDTYFLGMTPTQGINANFQAISF